MLLVDAFLSAPRLGFFAESSQILKLVLHQATAFMILPERYFGRKIIVNCEEKRKHTFVKSR